jgi:hypothetical protein
MVTIFCILSFAANSELTTVYTMAESPLDEVTPLIEATNATLKATNDAVRDIGPHKNSIDNTAKGDKAEDATASAWENLAKSLKDKAEPIYKKLNENAGNLPKQDQKITDLIKRPKDLKDPSKTDGPIAKLDEVQKSIKSATDAATVAQIGLKTSIDNLYKAAETSTAALVKQLEKLAPYPLNNNPAVMLRDLPDMIAPFDDNIVLQAIFATKWPLLDTELKKLTTSPSTKPADNIKANFEAASAILVKLIDWLKTLDEYNSDVQEKLLDTRSDLDQYLPSHAVAATKFLKQSQEEEDKLHDFLSKSEVISKLVTANEKYPKSVRDQLPVSVQILDSTLESFPQAIGMVREGLAGNFEDFVADFVPLYNFSDVRNLISILNPEMRELRSVSALRDEAESARRNLDQADLNLINLRATVAEIQTRLRNLQDELKQAENNVANSVKLFTQQDRLITELEGRPNPDTGRIARAKQRREDLEKQKTADEEKLANLTDEEKGLQPQIKTARDQLLVAQKLVREGRSTMVRLAQIESGAFAEARENESIYYALNNVYSRDPVKQVIIYGFASRKVIFLRGEEEDVKNVKDIISLFDRPAPQAKITLRTLEINSTADREGARRVNSALNFVENQLSNSRIKVAAALSFLRDCINEEVNNIATQKLNDLRNSRNAEGFGPVRNHRDVVVNDAEDLRWARLFFYEPEVLLRLGFDPEVRDAASSRKRNRIINSIALPDPAGTTTLGESLIVLSMAKARYRYTIIDKFTREIGPKLGSLGLCPDCGEEICGSDSDKTVKWFSSMKRALGADKDHNGYFYTSLQKEIVNAITLATVPKLISRLSDLHDILDNLSPNDVAAQKNVIDEMSTIQEFLWSNLGISTSPVRSSADPKDGFSITQSVKMTQSFADSARSTNVLRTASAQVARADLMLKQLIDAVNEDMDRHFVRPMVSCLRATLAERKGIGVGVISETSVLATNRLVARVDPRASAQFSIGDEQDALQAAQQLANLYMAAQTGGFLGGFAGLGGLQQRDVSEIYGLTTGSTFKVNPIFDPTGQTLRFQFDYVGANVVTDPDGSTNPQLPRIERHTVNTEVQLNNFELREISRFESNARLGIATKYTGGFPIIKDIPYVKYIPLIGWFTRRTGKSAVVQQSLMLGQTTMYPTIADIFDLLSSDTYYYYRSAYYKQNSVKR